jgi:hypothetical protein
VQLEVTDRGEHRKHGLKGQDSRAQGRASVCHERRPGSMNRITILPVLAWGGRPRQHGKHKVTNEGGKRVERRGERGHEEGKGGQVLALDNRRVAWLKLVSTV